MPETPRGAEAPKDNEIAKDLATEAAKAKRERDASAFDALSRPDMDAALKTVDDLDSGTFASAVLEAMKTAEPSEQKNASVTGVQLAPETTAVIGTIDALRKTKLGPDARRALDRITEKLTKKGERGYEDDQAPVELAEALEPRDPRVDQDPIKIDGVTRAGSAELDADVQALSDAIKLQTYPEAIAALQTLTEGRDEKKEKARLAPSIALRGRDVKVKREALEIAESGKPVDLAKIASDALAAADDLQNAIVRRFSAKKDRDAFEIVRTEPAKDDGDVFEAELEQLDAARRLDQARTAIDATLELLRQQEQRGENASFTETESTKAASAFANEIAQIAASSERQAATDDDIARFEIQVDQTDVRTRLAAAAERVKALPEQDRGWTPGDPEAAADAAAKLDLAEDLLRKDRTLHDSWDDLREMSADLATVKENAYARASAEREAGIASARDVIAELIAEELEDDQKGKRTGTTG